jgi:RNA polymerase sigma-70 factor (ECF subfamily)
LGVETAGAFVPHDPEPQWIKQSRAGDQRAFAALVERYWARIHRWLHGLTGGRHEAEDLAQETFLKAWDGLRTFRPGTHFKAWLFRIAHNCLVDHRRRTPPAPRRPAEGLPARGPGPVATLIGRETQALVRAAVDRLPPAYRAPFLLRTWEGLSYTDLARALGLTEQTARWRVCKARQFLLHQLGDVLDRPKP